MFKQTGKYTLKRNINSLPLNWSLPMEFLYLRLCAFALGFIIYSLLILITKDVRPFAYQCIFLYMFVNAFLYIIDILCTTDKYLNTSDSFGYLL